MVAKTVSFDVSCQKGGHINLSKDITLDSDKPLLDVYSAINSFDLGYTNGDHHLQEIKVDTSASLEDESTVKVSIDVIFQDKNGDDPFSGYVTVLVVGIQEL